jgi:hypothetical protein
MLSCGQVELRPHDSRAGESYFARVPASSEPRNGNGEPGAGYLLPKAVCEKRFGAACFTEVIFLFVWLVSIRIFARDASFFFDREELRDSDSAMTAPPMRSR